MKELSIVPLFLLMTFACCLQAADTVYVGVDYGLLRSTDAGATWNMVDVPLNTPFMKGFVRPEFLAMDPQNTSKLYFIGLAGGTSFFATADAGATWTVTPFIGLQPTHLAVDFAGKAIYITASPTRGTTYVYKSTNTGASWTQLPTPSTSQEPSGSTVDRIFADPRVSGTVYARSDNGYHFFKSTDFGSTWAEIVQNAPKKPSLVDPHNPLIWYSFSGDSDVSKSTDGASTFTMLNIPSDRVDSVSVGAVSSTLYAAGDVQGLGGTVLKSTDGGDTWTALQNGMFTAISGIVWADPVDASLVFANDFIYTRSFYVSTDSGAHFNPSKLPVGPPTCVPGNCSTPEITDLVFAVPAATTPPPPPVIPANGVVNGASFQPGIVPNSWVTIGGTNLAQKTEDWTNAIVNGQYPTSLDGVSVMIGGKPAYINFISSGQINLIAPDVGFGSLGLTVTTAGGTSATYTVTSSQYGPAFFQWPNSQPIATRLDYTVVVKNGTFAGVTTVAAKPGDVIVLWGTGFGPTNPIATPGMPVPGSPTYSTTTLPTVTVNNVPATVYGAALTPGFAGLYQVAIQVPDSLQDGDWPIQAEIGGVKSPAGILLTIKK